MKANLTFECEKHCPQDCDNDEYYLSRIIEHRDAYNMNETVIIKVDWDQHNPIVEYEETPIMTLTQYFCFMGGLISMWFGFSFNQVSKLVSKISIH